MKNPIQPILKDEHGTARFKSNKIVQLLLDSHPTMDMNQIARLDFSNEDRMQFAQLIGYSLFGFGELSYVDDETFYAAAKMYENGMDENAARIAALEQKLEEIRSAIDNLREPVARVFEMHPDDLKNN